ncbi:MAG: sulfite exporter TauE/SafE family protein [Limisphaerales bacterium]
MHDLTTFNWIILLAAVFAVAFFYSSVGHGGATGYLAALALVGVAPLSARVAVLIANVLVAGIAWWRFGWAGHFDWRVLLSFAVVSVPCAWLGSRVHISPQVYKIVLGAVLTAAGVVLLLRSRWQTDDVVLHEFFLPLALLIGAGLGFLAGLTGIGGGVFLSPLL